MNISMLAVVGLALIGTAYAGLAAHYGYGFNTHGKEGQASVHAQGSMHDYGFNLQQQHKGGSSYIKQNAAFTHETQVAVEPHHYHHAPQYKSHHAAPAQYHHAAPEHHYNSQGSGSASGSGFGGGFQW